MPTLSQTIQDKLNTCALIIRKYNLGDKSYFFSNFSEIGESFIEIAWAFGLKKIQNKEIIKDSHSLSLEDLGFVTNKIKKIDPATRTLYHYLNLKFELKPLKLADENIERRVRQLLAIKYLQIVSSEIFVLHKKYKNSFGTKASRFFIKYKYGLFAILIAGTIVIPRIIKGLTPVDTLTERIHEKSKYEYRIGAICIDGWRSNATSRGACSHHRGVSEWIYKTAYRKTWEECRKKAEKISWRD